MNDALLEHLQSILKLELDRLTCMGTIQHLEVKRNTASQEAVRIKNKPIPALRYPEPPIRPKLPIEPKKPKNA